MYRATLGSEPSYSRWVWATTLLFWFQCYTELHLKIQEADPWLWNAIAGVNICTPTLYNFYPKLTSSVCLPPWLILSSWLAWEVPRRLVNQDWGCFQGGLTNRGDPAHSKLKEGPRHNKGGRDRKCSIRIVSWHRCRLLTLVWTAWLCQALPAMVDWSL